MTVSVVTNNGIAKATAASSYGVQVSVTGAKISSAALSTDPNYLATLTDLPNIVYTTDNSVITYSRIDDNNILFRISLGSSVGNFTVNSYGLTLSDGTLFTVAVLDGPEIKVHTDPTGEGGNTRYYETIVNISNFANIANLSILVSNDTSLPEVNTEANLPNPNQSPFPAYFVHDWTAYHNLPALATRYNGSWYYYPSFEGGNPSMFESNVVPGNAVYFNTASNKFGMALGDSVVYAPIAMCGKNFTLVKLGEIYKSDNSVEYGAGISYYVDTVNAGNLTTTPNRCYVGIATSTYELYLNNFMLKGAAVANVLTVFSDAQANYIKMVNKGYLADEKTWSIGQNAKDFSLFASNDAETAAYVYFNAIRDKSSVTNVDITTSYNSSMQIGPNEAYMHGGDSVLDLKQGTVYINGASTTLNSTVTYINGKNATLSVGDIKGITGISSYISLSDTNTGSSIMLSPSGEVGVYAKSSKVEVLDDTVTMRGARLQYTNNNNGREFALVDNKVGMLAQLNGVFSCDYDSNGTFSGFSNIPNMSEFDFLNSTTGYSKSPNGMIFQWTAAGINSADISPDGVDVTVKITYPNEMLGVIISYGGNLPPKDGNIGADIKDTSTVHCFNSSVLNSQSGCHILTWGY